LHHHNIFWQLFWLKWNHLLQRYELSFWQFQLSFLSSMSYSLSISNNATFSRGSWGLAHVLQSGSRVIFFTSMF
jgi:hypothetical protein